MLIGVLGTTTFYFWRKLKKLEREIYYNGESDLQSELQNDLQNDIEGDGGEKVTGKKNHLTLEVNGGHPGVHNCKRTKVNHKKSEPNGKIKKRKRAKKSEGQGHELDILTSQGHELSTQNELETILTQANAINMTLQVGDELDPNHLVNANDLDPNFRNYTAELDPNFVCNKPTTQQC